MLRHLSPSYFRLLLEIVNKSPSDLEWLSAWKSVKVTMLAKKSLNLDSVANYKSIRLTSCVGKVVERVINNRLSSFLETNNLLTSERPG
jgi:hypothetical protein